MTDKKYTLNKKIPTEVEQEEEEDFVAGENFPLIPEGTYEVVCIRTEKGRSHFKSLKMFVWFIIVENEQYNRTKLFMAMNLIDTRTGKPFKKVPRGSKYFEQWVIANQNALPARDDRMSPSIFKSGLFEAVIRTVKPKFSDGTEKPDSFHYSVVDYLKVRLA